MCMWKHIEGVFLLKMSLKLGWVELTELINKQG